MYYFYTGDEYQLKYSCILIFVAFYNLSCTQQENAETLAQHQRMEAYRQEIRQLLGKKYDTPVAKADSIQLERGKYLFAELCSSCHGGLGRGRGRASEKLTTLPPNFTDPQQASFYSEQARLYIIRKGVPGTTMFGWEKHLSEEDILALYVHVRSLIKE